MLKAMSKLAVERLNSAIVDSNVESAIDWSTVLKYMSEAQLLYHGDYNESEKNQVPVEEEEVEESSDVAETSPE